MRSILLVEDHPESRSSLSYLLEKQGYRIHAAPNGRLAVAISRREELHALVLDLRLPDMDGLSVLDSVIEQHPGLPAVVVTSFGSIDVAVDAMKRGATDFLTKPISLVGLVAALERSIARAEARGAISTPPSQAAIEMERLGIIGRSNAMRALFDLMKRIAPHQSSVLVQGESGSGKELVARALHALGPRAAGPFVAINCATLAEALLESELFGHEKGAFTGADRAKQGVIETADQGTLFLDEVAEMGLGVQAKLLRVLERREFRRVGGTRKLHVDINVVAACNADLEACVSDGKFRADLFYRLKVVMLVVPPLRERTEAIPILAQRFLDDVAHHMGMTPKRLSPEALQHLLRHPWPGNVRELRNCMESLTLLTPRPVIDVDDLPPSLHRPRPSEVRLKLGATLEEMERELIRLNLDAHPTIKDAARALGVPLRTFHDKLKRHGLRRGS